MHLAAAARRPHAERGQARQDSRSWIRSGFATDSRDRSRLWLPRPAISGRSGIDRDRITVIADRDGRGDERLRLRRQRAGLSPHRRQLGPRPAGSRVVADIRNVVAGDPQPGRQGHARQSCRGIEVGHIFQLRQQVRAGDELPPISTRQGKQQAMEMGCYGIGVSRIVGAAIEQNHDERGIIWPHGHRALRRWSIVPIGYRKSEAVQRRRRRAVRRTAGRRASMSCSTTATSAPASCSPTRN
ncbi:MAG: hypothetical protein MZW92_66190 [Comamonadaceae bacterium]|nr:hypothetical protein [Comamonadaceae bacterium]